MTHFEKIKRYEKESGNTVLNNNNIVNSSGNYVGRFTIDMADAYHDIISELGEALDSYHNITSNQKEKTKNE
jgi:hypothetical protein